MLGQLKVQSRVCEYEFVLAPWFHRIGKNGVDIMVKKNYDILADATGGHRKKASLIS